MKFFLFKINIFIKQYIMKRDLTQIKPEDNNNVDASISENKEVIIVDNEITIFADNKVTSKVNDETAAEVDANDSIVITTAFSFDYDGCTDILFNGIETFLQAYDKHSDSYYTPSGNNWDQKTNKPFNYKIKLEKARNELYKLIELHSQNSNMLFVGSARQTNQMDKSMRAGSLDNHIKQVRDNSFTYSNEDGYCFKDLETFTKLNSSNTTKWVFNPIECRKCIFYESDHVYLKSIFIQEQLAHISDNQKTITDYHFIDDRMDILEGLKNRLNCKLLYVPRNITVHLHQYDWYPIIGYSDEQYIHNNYFIYKR